MTNSFAISHHTTGYNRAVVNLDAADQYFAIGSGSLGYSFLDTVDSHLGQYVSVHNPLYTT
jgi:hypothetical protein